MKNRKNIVFALVMASAVLPQFSWSAESGVAKPWISMPSADTLKTFASWKTPAALFAGTVVAYGLYRSYTDDNRKLAQRIDRQLQFNALDPHVFNFQTFAVNDFDNSGESFPDFIDIKLNEEKFSQKLNGFLFLTKRFIDNGRISKPMVCEKLSKEVEELRLLILELDDFTGFNKIVNRCCIEFARNDDRAAWKHKGFVSEDYFTDLFQLIHQCSTVDEFRSLNDSVVTKIMTAGRLQKLGCPFYEKLAGQQWKLIKRYMRVRCILNSALKQ